MRLQIVDKHFVSDLLFRIHCSMGISMAYAQKYATHTAGAQRKNLINWTVIQFVASQIKNTANDMPAERFSIERLGLVVVMENTEEWLVV